MKKNKICYFINGFANGGVEAVIYRYVSNFDKSKIEVCVISYNLIYDQKAFDKFVELGIKIYLIPYWKTHFINQCREIIHILNNEKFDIMHAHVNDMNWIPLVLAKYCHVPIRISHSHMSYNELSILRRMFYFGEEILIRISATDYFACSAEASKCLVVKGGGEFRKTFIMHNAIEVNEFLEVYNKKETIETIRKELCLNDEFIVGHVGRFTKQKNHVFLINVFALFVKKYENSKLLLVGTGELKKQIEALVKEKGLEEKVIFYGTSTKIRYLYEVMDTIVFPSFYEGLPVVCIEAQIAGIPLLVSDNVTYETKINENLKFLSLNDGHESWCSELFNIANERKKRYLDRETVEKAGFDITYEAKRIQKKYEELVRAGNK